METGAAGQAVTEERGPETAAGGKGKLAGEGNAREQRAGGEPMALSDFTWAAKLTPDVEAAVNDAFTYHPWDKAQEAAGNAVRQALAGAVKVIIANCPPGADRTVAIRKIREARMDANSAITHGGRY